MKDKTFGWKSILATTSGTSLIIMALKLDKDSAERVLTSWSTTIGKLADAYKRR